MLLPIGDDNRDRRSTPFINYLLIAINIFVFIYWQKFGRNDSFIFSYATIPGEILTGRDIVTDSELIKDPITGDAVVMPGLEVTPIPVFLTLFTSMFMHGGIAHLLGNMLYLWIFGDNIEDELGHRNYLIFYLLCGVLAGLSHVFTTLVLGHNPLVPSLGASGAIAGVLGGYLLLHPLRSVRVWVFLFVIGLPAIIVVGLWFVFQVMNGLGTLGGEEAGGIAYAAHIGGFVAGFLLVKLFHKKRKSVKKQWFGR